MPKRFYYYVTLGLKENIKKVFKDQVYLRKKTFKQMLVYHSKVTFVLYLFLSFIVEIRLFTDHHYAQVNKL